MADSTSVLLKIGRTTTRRVESVATGDLSGGDASIALAFVAILNGPVANGFWPFIRTQSAFATRRRWPSATRPQLRIELVPPASVTGPVPDPPTRRSGPPAVTMTVRRPDNFVWPGGPLVSKER